MTSEGNNLLQYFTKSTENVPLLHRLQVCRFNPGRSGRRKKWLGSSHRLLWKFCRSGCDQVGDTCVPARRGWVGEAISHMARDGSFSLGSCSHCVLCVRSHEGTIRWGKDFLDQFSERTATITSSRFVVFCSALKRIMMCGSTPYSWINTLGY